MENNDCSKIVIHYFIGSLGFDRQNIFHQGARKKHRTPQPNPQLEKMPLSFSKRPVPDNTRQSLSPLEDGLESEMDDIGEQSSSSRYYSSHISFKSGKNILTLYKVGYLSCVYNC